MIRLPKEILDLFPMWEYRCFKCGSFLGYDPIDYCVKCGATFSHLQARVPPSCLKNKKAMLDYVRNILIPKFPEKERLLRQYFKLPRISPLQVRVIYYDLSEWLGKSSKFNESPHKGILTISITYPDKIHRHLMSGKDYYYVKDHEIGAFQGDDKFINIIKLEGPNQERIEKRSISTIDLDFLRMGVWVEDRIMRIANKRILERE